MTLRLLAACAAAVILTGAGKPDIRTDFDPVADFSDFQSYAWIYQAPPRGMDPQLYERIRSSIDRELNARGHKQRQGGDTAIAFTIGPRDKVDVADLGPYGASYGLGWRQGFRWSPGPGYDERQFTEGTLVIDLYNAHTKQAVWHGKAPLDAADVDKTVAALVARIPTTRQPFGGIL